MWICTCTCMCVCGHACSHIDETLFTYTFYGVIEEAILKKSPLELSGVSQAF